MIIRYGKSLDSARLKRDLDKTSSIAAARDFSTATKPGPLLDSCPACDSPNATDLATIYGFKYRECSGCGSAFVANPPESDAIEAAYKSDYYTAANKILLANERVIDYRLDTVARPKVQFVVDNLTTSKRTWLDVGCGVGEILAAAEDSGFQVLGLETNTMEAEFARTRFGIDVRDEYVTPDTVRTYESRYGVISLFSVLEHVSDPRAILRTMSKVQGPGDNIVIETPHFPSISSFSQICFPEHVNRMMHPPLHLFLFSTNAIMQMLRENDYEPCALWYFGQDFYELISTLGVLHPQINGSRLHEAASAITNAVQKEIDASGFSDEMLVVAKHI